MKRSMMIACSVMIGLFIGSRGFAQDTKEPSGSIDAFMSDKLIGSLVINTKGETLGNIDNLVVDVDTGKILYVVLESGGFLGVGDKLFPVPWRALAVLPSEGLFVLNKSKEQVEKAPAFERRNVPNMGDRSWGSDVFKYYGVPVSFTQSWPLDDEYESYGSYPPDAQSSRISRTGDPYRKLFDPKTVKSISGRVIKVDQVPEFGFGLQLRVTVFVDRQNIVPVYLGPAYYLAGPWKESHCKLGDMLTVTGSRTVVGGEPIMIAITVKRGNEMLRVRNTDGIAEWVGWKKASE